MNMFYMKKNREKKKQGCETLRNFLLSKHFKLKSNLIPYDSLAERCNFLRLLKFNKERETEDEKGCNGCNVSHFPHGKFCRWWRNKHKAIIESKKGEFDQSTSISCIFIPAEWRLKIACYVKIIETKLMLEQKLYEMLLKEKIFLLFYMLMDYENSSVRSFLNARPYTRDFIVESTKEENRRKEIKSYQSTKKEESLENACKIFLRKTCDSTDFPDITFEKYCSTGKKEGKENRITLKLKGGVKSKQTEETKVKSFVSNEKELNTVFKYV
jgi:hypothetical protein